MAPKRQAITDQLRAAIVGSGLTNYRLGKDTGVKPGQIDRFVKRERDLRMETAAKLCEALGLELKPKGKK